MPIEVARFGVGHRRPDGPPGSVGVRSQLIHSDGRGTITEVAFARDARVEPHSSPDTTWMVVIEGGGWVAVAEERTRVAAGEAVLWPPDEIHGAWTDYSHMRAIVVEFSGPDDSAIQGILPGSARELLPGEPHAERGDGALAPGADAVPHDRSEGEPV
jgi:quercetin dioxygenase-like cupin family protein